MSRRWLLSLLCLSVVAVALTIFVQLSSAAVGLSVNESATRFLIQDRTIVVLEVNNPTSQEVPVQLKLELIDPDDVTRGVAITDLWLKPGANKLSIPLTLSANSYQDEEKIPWYRLRYQIRPSTTGQALGAAQGFISLSEIDTPNLFALEVTAPGKTYRGARYYVHVRTSGALTQQPATDVKVSVELRFDEDDGKGTVSGSGVTDATGHALIALDVPAKLDSDDGELTVIARHGGYSRKSASEIDLSDDARIMVTTDKPIYQPGQSLHVRALVFSSAKRAAPNAEATIRITDPENSTVSEQSVRTSRFGVATADWTIPESTRLGDYTITVDLDEEGYGDSEGYQRVKISRYDLPTFAVSVKPDRTYYLPLQNADVEVRADYLFGQPVKRGHVRLVRERDRQWNYREQKWEATEGATYEGNTDAEGRFVAHVDLKEAHEELADQEYSRFTDLTFAAFFTDPTTNRTEQKRFDLRVTKEAIHIYVSEGRYRQADSLPMQFYLATSYADGAPASCEVALLESGKILRNQPPHAPFSRGLRPTSMASRRWVVYKHPTLPAPGTTPSISSRGIRRPGRGATSSRSTTRQCR